MSEMLSLILWLTTGEMAIDDDPMPVAKCRAVVTQLDDLKRRGVLVAWKPGKPAVVAAQCVPIQES